MLLFNQVHSNKCITFFGSMLMFSLFSASFISCCVYLTVIVSFTTQFLFLSQWHGSVDFIQRYVELYTFLLLFHLHCKYVIRVKRTNNVCCRRVHARKSQKMQFIQENAADTDYKSIIDYKIIKIIRLGKLCRK